MTSNNDDNDWQKLPTEQKVQHKAWKARMTGYEECVKLFRTQSSDQSPEYNKYVNLMKKFVTDANENAREKALDAVFAFVEEAQIAGKTVTDVAPGLINKCLNARSKMKERAFDILLMYIEIEKQNETEEEVIKGLENKQPKIVQSCLELLRKGLLCFGSKILPIKPFLKQVIPLLDDRDKTVRDEAKLLLVEVYRWIGKQTLMPMLQNIKPIQIQELQVEFDKLDLNGADKPRPTRFIRSQQELRQKYLNEDDNNTVTVSGAVDPLDAEISEDIDPFDLIEPVNILERLSKDFFAKIESKQWKDRKEVLDDLLNVLTANPRPASDSDYSELIKAMKKIIAKDSNIPVVCVTSKCLTALARGLRQTFKVYAVSVIEVCLDRCREKKSNVIEALREACDAAFPTTNLELLSEVVVAVLAHKTPIVRQCTQQFLTKAFSMSNAITLPKKLLKVYLPPLIKNTAEADPTVRDSAFESLGMLWKCLGEKQVLPNLTDMDELKMNKIKEYAEKSILLTIKGEPRPAVMIALIPPPKVEQPTTVVKKTLPSSTSSEPVTSKPVPIPIIKKKSTPASKPPVVAATESNEEKRKEIKPIKTTSSIQIASARPLPPRAKPTNSTVASIPNGRNNATKSRPMTAPITSSKLATTTNNSQLRTQQVLPTVAPAVQSKTRTKPPVSSTARRSSIGPTISSSTSNLQRQSTSTGGSTSSLSSTNTQASIPCTRLDTPTSKQSAPIMRSVSNDLIASPAANTAAVKSRIPVRAIPVSLLKKSST